MNEVFKNTHIFVDVLSMARCDTVQEWDEGAFQKAYKWANYFEEVYRKLKTKPALAEKLDKYLQNFYKSGQVYLGNLTLSFQLLGKSKLLLKQFLLQNPHLSDNQYQMVLQLYGMRIGKSSDCSNTSDLLKDVCILSQTKAAVGLVSRMRDRLTEDMRCTLGSSTSGGFSAELTGSTMSSVKEFPSARDSAEIVVAATSHCLFNYVQHHVKFTDPKHRKLLGEKLQILAVQENGLKSIISSLLLTPEDCSSRPQVETVTHFVLEWLIGFLSQPKPHPQLMSITPVLLGRAAFVSVSFFKLYLSHLVSWADLIVPTVCSNEDEWIHNPRGIEWRNKKHLVNLHDTQDEANQNLTFSNLVCHLRHLLAGPSFIADVTRKTIHSHATQDDLPSVNKGRNNGCKARNLLNCNIWEDICALLDIS